ncbi:TetR/AcrR family transcriptional regulator [Crossiella cryophila]|uniref:AcrR family transcriptional regulator n=1 Tax=Crossiella cryophila TaxID=43355 RepID=A0A7W7CGY0_9PSEU|nr:TetR/AcrR family transcriptional regulator [Crossiella cryophila]MBB4679294.1 AcrR family transcriptional regulator [Crossiella cryophila]
MARTDVEEQKAQIAEALWRLAARAGLEAVSVREVAAEAGVSVGRVQHYFRSKDAMLLYGLKLAGQRMETRIADRLTGLAGSPEQLLRAALEEVLGDDADTRQAIRVNVAFLGRAMEDVEIADVLFQDNAELRALAAYVVRIAQSQGRAAGLDPEREARIIWSLADALTIELACGQLSAAEAGDTMRYHLDRVLR